MSIHGFSPALSQLSSGVRRQPHYGASPTERRWSHVAHLPGRAGALGVARAAQVAYTYAGGPGPPAPLVLSPGGTVRPLGILGWALIVLGGVVLALGGVSYLKERESAKLGPIEVATERRGFVPPVAGAAAVVLGLVLVVADRRRRRT
jgi:hypothetical protein